MPKGHGPDVVGNSLTLPLGGAGILAPPEGGGGTYCFFLLELAFGDAAGLSLLLPPNNDPKTPPYFGDGLGFYFGSCCGTGTGILVSSGSLG